MILVALQQSVPPPAIPLSRYLSAPLLPPNFRLNFNRRDGPMLLPLMQSLPLPVKLISPGMRDNDRD